MSNLLLAKQKGKHVIDFVVFLKMWWDFHSFIEMNIEMKCYQIPMFYFPFIVYHHELWLLSFVLFLLCFFSSSSALWPGNCFPLLEASALPTMLIAPWIRKSFSLGTSTKWSLRYVTRTRNWRFFIWLFRFLFYFIFWGEGDGGHCSCFQACAFSGFFLISGFFTNLLLP